MSQRIPTPQERPGADIVIYDGQCPLCTFTVKTLARLDWRHRLAFIALQDPEVARRWPLLSHEQLMEEVTLITPQGQIDRGAQVVRAVTRQVPLLWPAALLVHIPGSLPLWQRLYGLVSRWRYVFGRREA